MKKLIIAVIVFISISNITAQSVLHNQNLTGNINGKEVHLNYNIALNTISGEAEGHITNLLNPEETPPCSFFDITVCNITIKFLMPQNGAENLSSVIEGSTYSRELTYEFSTGEKITFNSDINIENHSSQVSVNGTYPVQLQADFDKYKKVSLIAPVTFEIESSDGAVYYEGTTSYLVGLNKYDIKVSTKYTFIGKKMSSGNKIILLSGTTTLGDNNNIIKNARFTLTK